MSETTDKPDKSDDSAQAIVSTLWAKAGLYQADSMAELAKLLYLVLQDACDFKMEFQQSDVLISEPWGECMGLCVTVIVLKSDIHFADKIIAITGQYVEVVSVYVSLGDYAFKNFRAAGEI